jgi:hypothetical protein
MISDKLAVTDYDFVAMQSAAWSVTFRLNATYNLL